ANTNTMYIKNEKNGAAGEFIAGTKNGDGTFTFTVTDVDIMNYKYYNDQLDASVEYKADGTAVTDNRTADAQVQTTYTDIVLAWAGSTGVNNVDANKYKVYTSNKSVIIEGVTSKAELLDMSGRIIESKVMSGTFRSETLKAGLYIIKVDGQTQKVAIK
ncbi:MAG: T9SS type A sorting domain-containing protein, partial [Paludibacter sp.]|nr:T9SS type A sorting domain-containing protein [Paludibacter sp.]